MEWEGEVPGTEKEGAGCGRGSRSRVTSRPPWGRGLLLQAGRPAAGSEWRNDRLALATAWRTDSPRPAACQVFLTLCC